MRTPFAFIKGGKSPVLRAVKAWYRADASNLLQVGGATVTTTGQTVGTWLDLSGNGNTATKNGSDSCTWVSAVAGAKNKPAVNSANISQSLKGSFAYANPCSFFVVYTTTLAAGSNGRALGGSGSNWLIGPRTNGGVLEPAYFAGAFSGFGTTIATSAQVVIQGVTQSITSGKMWSESTQRTPNVANPGVPGLLNLFSSNSEAMTGNIFEVLAYTDELTAIEVAQNLSYLASEYT